MHSFKNLKIILIIKIQKYNTLPTNSTYWIKQLFSFQAIFILSCFRAFVRMYSSFVHVSSLINVLLKACYVFLRSRLTCCCVNCVTLEKLWFIWWLAETSGLRICNVFASFTRFKYNFFVSERLKLRKWLFNEVFRYYSIENSLNSADQFVVNLEKIVKHLMTLLCLFYSHSTV